MLQSLVDMIALPDIWMEERVVLALGNQGEKGYGLLSLACDPSLRSSSKRFAIIRLIMCLIDKCEEVSASFQILPGCRTTITFQLDLAGQTRWCVEQILAHR